MQRVTAGDARKNYEIRRVTRRRDGGHNEPGSEENGGKSLMESVSKLESLSLASTLLEELAKRMSAREPSALERMTTLLGHRIVRVIPVVKPLS